MTQGSRTESTALLVWTTASIGFGLAALLFVLRLALGDLPPSTELPGALTLGAVAATPPTLAVLGLRRPGLLLAAGATAVLSLPVLSILGILEIALGVFWLIAFGRTGDRGSILRALVAALAILVLWAGAASVLFVHLDPRCAQTLANGSVLSVEASGFQSGWVWDAGSTVTGSGLISVDVVAEVCSSDVVTPLEMVIALGLLAAALGTGWVLVEPVPEGAGLTA